LFGSGFTVFGNGKLGDAINNAWGILDTDKDNWVTVGDVKA
jgi:hypothetical protein